MKYEKMKMKKIIAIFAAAMAVCMMFTACGGNKTPEETVSETSSSDDETISIYTGKEVENEEDLAIYKFNCKLPEGYETAIDDSEGKAYVSPYSSITVKARNYKEEYQALDVFADQACAGILMSNAAYQAETNFSDPVKTTVGGFDALRYDYTVTAYIYDYETDSEGNIKADDNGNPVVKSKDIYGEYVNRAYFFYSDEDVFYFICEAQKDSADKAAEDFDKFVESVTITPALKNS